MCHLLWTGLFGQVSDLCVNNPSALSNYSQLGARTCPNRFWWIYHELRKLDSYTSKHNYKNYSLEWIYMQNTRIPNACPCLRKKRRLHREHQAFPIIGVISHKWLEYTQQHTIWLVSAKSAPLAVKSRLFGSQDLSIPDVLYKSVDLIHTMIYLSSNPNSSLAYIEIHPSTREIFAASFKFYAHKHLRVVNFAL